MRLTLLLWLGVFTFTVFITVFLGSCTPAYAPQESWSTMEYYPQEPEDNTEPTTKSKEPTW